MIHDEVLEELWRIKDEIALECEGDVHALVRSLRESEQTPPPQLPVGDDTTRPGNQVSLKEKT